METWIVKKVGGRPMTWTKVYEALHQSWLYTVPILFHPSHILTTKKAERCTSNLFRSIGRKCLNWNGEFYLKGTRQRTGAWTTWCHICHRGFSTVQGFSLFGTDAVAPLPLLLNRKASAFNSTERVYCGLIA